MAEEQEALGLEDATFRALRTMGPGVLREPRRFLSCLMDLMGADSPEMRVLERNCDVELLARLVDAANEGSVEALRAAATATEWELHQGRFISEEVAHKVAWGMARGLARYAGTNPDALAGTALPTQSPIVVQPVPVTQPAHAQTTLQPIPGQAASRPAHVGGPANDVRHQQVQQAQTAASSAPSQSVSKSATKATSPASSATPSRRKLPRWVKLAIPLAVVTLLAALLLMGMLPISFSRKGIAKGVWAELSSSGDITLHNTSDMAVHVLRIGADGSLKHKSVRPGHNISLGATTSGWLAMNDGISSGTGMKILSKTVVKSSPVEIRLEWESVGKVHPLGVLYGGKLAGFPAMVLTSMWRGSSDPEDFTWYTSHADSTFREPPSFWHSENGRYHDNECWYMVYYDLP